MTKENIKFEIHAVTGGCTFMGEINGYRLIFEQYDDGPITLNLDSLREAIGVKELTVITNEMISHLVGIATPAIEQARYLQHIMNAFSLN